MENLNLGNMEQNKDLGDSWGWEGELVPVPGFGFLPEAVNLHLDSITQELANMSGLDMSNVSVAFLDHYKCTVFNQTWPDYFPFLANKAPESVCGPLWDQASCVPPTLAGSLAVFPCMTMFEHKFFDTNYNASRSCLPDGQWASLTNYSDCRELCLQTDRWTNSTSYVDCDNIPGSGGLVGIDIRANAYFVGYSISFFSLLLALSIYLFLRELRCLRHKIHIGLFLTLILADTSWIFSALIQSLVNTEHYETVMKILCVSQVILRYFHLTTFYWMFLEGLYLFLQVQLPLSLATIRYIHFLLIGWGLPLLNMALWCILRVYLPRPPPSLGQYGDMDSEMGRVVLACPFIEDTQIDTYIYKLPVFILLVANTFFLIWIMVIVISKLRSRTALDHDRRHWKAAKALVIVIPLLGFTYLLTLVGPSKVDTPTAFMVYEGLRATLLSLQGAVITLPYCFLNSEVQGVLKTHWNRWKMVRAVGQFGEGHSTRTSVAHTTTYYTQVGGSSAKLRMMTTKLDTVVATKQDTKLLSVPTLKASPSSPCSRSVSFSDDCQPFNGEQEGNNQ